MAGVLLENELRAQALEAQLAEARGAAEHAAADLRGARAQLEDRQGALQRGAEERAALAAQARQRPLLPSCTTAQTLAAQPQKTFTSDCQDPAKSWIAASSLGKPGACAWQHAHVIGQCHRWRQLQRGPSVGQPRPQLSL